MTLFIGIIHKDITSDYSVCFPDFPGCVTAGVTMDEARVMAEEALQFHIDGLAEDNDPLPERPMSLDEAKAHEFAEDASAFIVVEASLPSKALRVNITMDEGLLRRIDAVAKNRSAFLAKAAKEYLRQYSSKN